MTTRGLVNLGCRTNAAETDELAALLAEADNFIVVNSCTVTGNADRDTRHAVARARREHPGAAVLLLGCYVDSHPGDALGADLAIPNRQKGSPIGVEERLEPPGARRSRYVLKVQDGCDNRCTFCIVWQTRGRSISRVPPYLEARARAATRAGYREIVLTGIDLGSYRGGLAPLVRRLVAAVAPVRLRLSSIDPSHLDDEVASLFALEGVCPHLHLPLQSGSDRVLARMRRRYDVAGFRRAVELARSAQPDLALTGDVMVGFPGESDDDFEATRRLVDWAGFMDLHVFRFSPRPRTAAARYPDQVAREVGRARSQALIEQARRQRLAYAARFAGRLLHPIWERAQGDIVKGVTENYLQAQAPAQGRRAGQLEEVRWAS